MSNRPAVSVKLEGVSSITLKRDECGYFGAFAIVLFAVAQGFEPIDYMWETDAEVISESPEGQRVKICLSIGSWKNLQYEHEFKVTATDEYGHHAFARYTIHLIRPTVELTPLYDEPGSRIGARGEIRSNGQIRQLFAYRTVTVRADTEGFLGRVDYIWTPSPVEGEEAIDIDTAVFGMVMNGDLNRIESYEGMSVGVTVTDEIGQSVSSRRFVEAVKASRPRLHATFHTPRDRTTASREEEFRRHANA